MTTAALHEFEKLKPSIQNAGGKANGMNGAMPELEAPRLTDTHIPAHHTASAGMPATKQTHGFAQNGLPHIPPHTPVSTGWGGGAAPKGAPAPGKYDAALKNNNDKAGGQKGNIMNSTVSKVLHQMVMPKPAKEHTQTDIAAAVAKVLRGAAGHSDLH